jgi:type I restriction enzyme S subunit
VLAFADVVDFREGPGILAKDFRDSGVPLVRLAGLTSPDLLVGCNHLDPKMVEQKWSHFALAEGDILLSTSASLGRIARVSARAAGSIPYTGLIRMRPKDARVSLAYLEFLLRDPSFQVQIEAMGAGSVMRHFGPAHLRQMTVRVPPLADQRRIAGVLGALDDKIEQNRVLGRRCEDLAATQFAELFRDVDDRLPISDLVNVHRESVLPTSRPGDVFEHYSIPAFDAGEVPVHEEGSAILSSKTILPAGASILVSKLNPVTPRIWWVHPTAPETAVCSSEFIVLRPKSEELASFMDASLRHDGTLYDEVLSHVSGTTGSRQRVKPADILACSVVAATDTQLSQFDAVARPLLELARTRLQENACLAAIRDALLPKLVAGTIRVPESYVPA